MPIFNQSLWLLAAWRTNWRDSFDGVYFKSNTEEVWLIFSVTGVLVVSVLLWQLFTSWVNGRLPSNSPRGLFRELCRAHRIDRAGRRLLKRLAVARGITPPVLLFVHPECFSVADLPDDLNDHAMEIVRLDEILFSTPAAEGGR